MIEWLLHNWEGYVRLRLHGYSPERFLNLCNARGLEVWGLICNRDGDYEFFMTVEGYRRVKPLVRKAQVRLHITGRYGLPFLFTGTGSAGITVPESWPFHGALCYVPVYLGYPV